MDWKQKTNKKELWENKFNSFEKCKNPLILSVRRLEIKTTMLRNKNRYTFSKKPWIHFAKSVNNTRNYKEDVKIN